MSGYLYLPIILMLLLLLSCGADERKSEVERGFVSLREKVRIVEEMSTTNDDALRAGAEVNRKLDVVRALIVEDSYKKALTMMAEIEENLRPFFDDIDLAAESPPQLMESGDIRLYGKVFSKTSEKGRYKAHDRSLSVISNMFVKTGIRSSAVFSIFEDGLIQLHDQSEIQILEWSPQAKRVQIRLLAGGLDISQEQGLGDFSLYLGDYTFQVAGPTNLKLFSDVYKDTRYLANYSEPVNWYNATERSQLFLNQALLITGTRNNMTNLPSEPQGESPDNLETIYAPTGKADVFFRWRNDGRSNWSQLQISRNINFYTRVYDNSYIEGESQSVTLEPGTYYWRVAGVTDTRVPSRFSGVSVLHVKSQKFGEDVPVAVPAGEDQGQAGSMIAGPEIKDLDINVINNTVIVSGVISSRNSQVNARVMANGQPAILKPTGEFRAILNIRGTGTHSIRVVATDLGTGGETITTRQVELQ